MDDFLTRKALWEAQDFQREAVFHNSAFSDAINMQDRIDDARRIQEFGTSVNTVVEGLWTGFGLFSN